MELNAQYVFRAPPARVWDALMDPATIAACLPGCKQFEAIGVDRYRVKVTAGVAAISGTFEGTITLADKQPERSYRLVVEGRGGAGFANGESTITLTAAESGATVVEVAAVMTVGGLVAQVGQRLLATTARIMMDRFFKSFMLHLDS